jgi:hypothetical protein
MNIVSNVTVNGLSLDRLMFARWLCERQIITDNIEVLCSANLHVVKYGERTCWSCNNGY